MIQRLDLDRLADRFTGPEDLDPLVKAAIIFIQLRVISLPGMIVSCRAEDQIIDIAFFICPFLQIIHQSNDHAAIQIADIIAQYAELTNTDAV